MRRTVRWLRLELEGFGVWREATRFRFPERFGVLSLPNERGKSTLCAGLQAVLFGLPAGELDDLRSWGEPALCRGRLDLAADGKVIRIRRDLASHETTVEEIDEAGETREVLFRGAANPLGRTHARDEYEERLAAILGDLADGKLFRATFLIEQPVVPAGEAGEALRTLVSGVGRIGGEEARDVLFEEVKKLTLATGDLGLVARGKERPTNQRTDGRIEQIEAEIEALRSRMAEGAEGFGRLEAFEEELARSREEMRQAEEDQAHARADRERLEGYRKSVDARDQARTARDELAQVLARYDEEAAAAEKARALLNAEFPDLADLPADVGAAIEEAAGLETKGTEAAAEVERRRKALVERGAEAARAEEEVGGDPELAGRADEFPARLDLLRTEAARLAAAGADRARREADREAKMRVLQEQGRWGRIPAGGAARDPVAWLARARTTAEQWRETFARLRDLEAARVEAAAERDRLAAVAVLPEEVQEELARYPETIGQLEEKEAFAASAEGNRRLLGEEAERRREELERRYASLDGIETEPFLRALEERAARHRRIAELDERAAQLRATETGGAGRWRWRRALLVGLPAGAAAAVALIAMNLAPAAAVAAGAVLLAIAFAVLGRPRARTTRTSREEIASCERESGELKHRLQLEFIPSGPWLPDDAGAFERAREFLRQRDDDIAAFLRMEDSLRDPTAAADAQAMRASARAARERLEAQAREIGRATGLEPPAAVQEYRRQSAALLSSVSQIESTWRDVVDADAPAARDAEDPLACPFDVLAPRWRVLEEAVQVLDLDARTVRELDEALAARGAADWDAWEAGARAYASALAAIEAPEGAGAEEASALAARVAALRQECAPFDETTGEREFAARWQRAREARERLDAARARRAQAEEELHGSEERAAAVDLERRAARERIGAERLARSEDSLGRLRERIRAREDREREIGAAGDKAAQLLASARGGPFAGRDALAAAVADFDDRRRDAQSSIDAALEASDLVKSYRDADPPAQDRIRREVESRASEREERARRARGTLSDAQARLEAWRPSASVNLAEMELDIARREESLEVLKRRRDAAARAWHLLGAAIEEFRSAHRGTLEAGLDRRFRAITRRDARRILLNQRLGVEIVEDGVPSGEARLSQGARDQLAFCLRLAVADLVAGEMLLPLILDDPFVHSDAERLARIRAALDEAAGERQVLLLTQDERLSGWGEPVVVERAG